jgi:transcriptional regulator of acetoin/glycerol metabolism
MTESDIKRDTDKLYKMFEVKLEDIADNLLLSKINSNDNILFNIQEMIEKVFIVSAMKISNNNVSGASKLLGINRNTLAKKLKNLGADNLDNRQAQVAGDVRTSSLHR